MKKQILVWGLLMGSGCIMAQGDIKNNGNLQVHSGGSFSGFGNFTNAVSGVLTNNGSLYLKQNITNDQSAMTVGTGTLYLNGSAAQSVNGSQPFKTYHLNSDNNSGIAINNNLSVSGIHTFTG
ncbi:MAG: hypothetical protein JNN00_15250, partial [Chitinophagaceae bacterium]|nr:hypothetical protein [Chitinophagaceae bacterium]